MPRIRQAISRNSEAVGGIEEGRDSPHIHGAPGYVDHLTVVQDGRNAHPVQNTLTGFAATQQKRAGRGQQQQFERTKGTAAAINITKVSI